MDNQKIGDYICNLRKERNLTQKELAEQLGVTDKAVSKWERGAGYPDISLLRPLAAILGTSVNELLEGEATVPDSPPEKEVLTNALAYADKLVSIKKYSISRIIAAVLAVLLFTAIFTSVIVDVAVNHDLTWSYIVTASCVFGGCLFLPPILYKKKGFFISLCLLTVLIIPFLAILQNVTFRMLLYPSAVKALLVSRDRSDWLWPIGIPICVIWLIILWLIVLLSRIKSLSIWFMIGIGTLLCIPGQLLTNYAVDKYVQTVEPSYRDISNISSVIAILTVAGIFAVIGFLKKMPKKS